MIQRLTEESGDPSSAGSLREFLRQGQPTAPLPLVPLIAGPLRLLYDPASGFVRYLRLGDHEILRGIYAAVRDRNWGTVPAVFRELKREIRGDRFAIELQAEHHLDAIHFVWRGLIQGGTDGTVRYDLDGEAKTTFLRNRIGFCVLHPVRECAGAPGRQTRVDGGIIECTFPDTIEPQIVGKATFRDMRAMAHQITPGLWAEITFEGDVFEMEDQRNWTDASFKTYSTPLALPFPVEIASGTRVRQSVCLRLQHEPAPQRAVAATRAAEPGPVSVTMPAKPAGRLPRLGLGVSSQDQSLSATEVARLRALGLEHLRVDVKLDAPGWGAAWERATHQASQLGLRIELALHLPREVPPNLDALEEALRWSGVPLARVLALRDGELATRPQTIALVRQYLATLDVPIGGGSDCNFCELNREQALGHFALTDSDFVFWSMNPQVHAFDRLSLVESLEAQTHTARSARVFAGNRPLVISPVTLRQRFNPVATGPESTLAPGALPPQVDPRQLSLFGAGWTLGSLAALTEAGVDSLTYYETTGWRGIMETSAGSPIPERFPARPGQVFPLYHVFASCVGCPDAAMVSVSDPLAVTALALFDRAQDVHLLLANVSDSVRKVQLAGWRYPQARWRVLGELNVVELTDAPDKFGAQPGEPLTPQAGILRFDLPPFAFTRIDP